MKKKDNVCGIVGLCTGWFIPILGFGLGIAALCRDEPDKVYGISAIVVSVIFWIIWMSVLLG